MPKREIRCAYCRKKTTAWSFCEGAGKLCGSCENKTRPPRKHRRDEDEILVPTAKADALIEQMRAEGSPLLAELEKTLGPIVERKRAQVARAAFEAEIMAEYSPILDAPKEAVPAMLERSPRTRRLLHALDAHGGNWDAAIDAMMQLPGDQVDELAAATAKD